MSHLMHGGLCAYNSGRPLPQLLPTESFRLKTFPGFPKSFECFSEWFRSQGPPKFIFTNVSPQLRVCRAPGVARRVERVRLAAGSVGGRGPRTRLQARRQGRVEPCMVDAPKVATAGAG
eukprot:6173887-Pleurochrysis_carterae.AAC.2